MLWSDDGGGKEKVRNSGGRSFQRQGAVTDMDRDGGQQKRTLVDDLTVWCIE